MTKSKHEDSGLYAQSSADVVAALAAERAQCSNFHSILAFDADGTLWSGDLGIEIFEALLRAEGVRPTAVEALEREAAAFDIAVSGSPTEIARHLYGAYETHRYPEARAFAMMAWVFAGFTEQEMSEFAAGVVEAARLDERLHYEVRPVIDWARSEAIETWIVSASPQAVVRQAARRWGFPSDCVLGMAPRMEGGVLAPALDGDVVYADGKVAALRRHRPDAVILGAFGDSLYDASLLRSARLPVAIRPKPSLLGVAESVPRLVTLVQAM